MRWGAGVAVAVMLGGLAFADPIAADKWLHLVREGTPARKREVVRALVEGIRTGGPLLLDVGRIAVISDDPAVRAPLIDALIAAKVIDRPTAAQVPTASVLQKRIRQLLPKEKPEQLPAASDCKLTGGTSRGAELTCNVSHCRGSCVRETRELTFTTGVRWTVVETQHRAIDDGSCGDCMLIE